MFSHCASGGWALGHTADGTQAEFVRIPFADTSLYLAPPGIDDESLVMMSDVMPTAYECGVLSGRLRPGQTAAVIGAGPIGLGFILAARMFSPSQLIAIDKDDNRLEIARAMGATMVINNSNDKADAEVLEHTGGKGVDLAVEAVGIPSTFELCQAIVAPGGRIANIGVHGAPATLHLEKLWSHNITLTTRLVDTCSTIGLLQTLRRGAIQPRRLVTHRFAFSNFPDAYEVFSHASDRRAIKVLVSV
jgi:alcohol dehydrogenase